MRVAGVELGIYAQDFSETLSGIEKIPVGPWILQVAQVFAEHGLVALQNADGRLEIATEGHDRGFRPARTANGIGYKAACTPHEDRIFVS